MHDEIYSDGIGEVTISNSVVRVDLVTLSPTERDANNNPISVFRQRIIFSVEGFANSIEVMQKAFQGLVDAGAIRRSVPDQAGTEVAHPAPTENRPLGTVVASRRKLSPNFG